MTIQETRIRFLNAKSIQPGEFVLYWMQQAQRAQYNHALVYAVREANRMRLPVVVVFGLTDDYPDANARHYRFMLEGLRETQAELAQHKILMQVRRGNPDEVALQASARAALIVCDRGYARCQKAWRENVARRASCTVVEVETDVIIPVEVVSDKAEYAARTIRPKINRHLPDYLTPLRHQWPKTSSLDIKMHGVALNNLKQVLSDLLIDHGVSTVSAFFKGGSKTAQRRFRRFIAKGLPHYEDHGNQPQTNDISCMSPYLHFGQISPLWLSLTVSKTGAALADARDAYLEQLIVRRELAMNFVNFNPHYDQFDCLPPWAQKTLAEHALDPRAHIYSREELEKAETHDIYWNAAMKEMKCTGFMHNYMRMYWGKKVLEWSRTPREAFDNLIAMNNKYFLDGRDPNSYAGAAWIFGLHDRAWAERSVFGKVRYMAASGLERKCDIKAYVRKVEALELKMAKI